MRNLLIFSFLFVFGQLLNAQSFPSMKGYWYCKSTDEMFVISVDPNQTIKGRGVYYSNGNGRFTQMQIMTQTSRKESDGTIVYLLRAYDLAKPKKVYELISKQDDGRIILEATVTGARDAIYIFHNVKDLHE